MINHKINFSLICTLTYSNESMHRVEIYKSKLNQTKIILKMCLTVCMRQIIKYSSHIEIIKKHHEKFCMQKNDLSTHYSKSSRVNVFNFRNLNVSTRNKIAELTQNIPLKQKAAIKDTLIHLEVSMIYHSQFFILFSVRFSRELLRF